LYGAYIYEHDLEKLYPENFCLTNTPENLCRNTDLEYIHLPDAESFYFGLAPYSILDDETGRQFKDRVEAEIKTILGSDVECNWHEGVIYD
jgi:hypothetical protein